MLLPLGTDRPLRRPTLLTHVLIGVNVIVFLAQLILARFEPELAQKVYQALWLHGKNFTPWSLATYQFVHGGFMHIAGNMLFLYVFGPNLEDRLGRWWFLLFYLVGGAAAGAAHAIWEPGAPVVGASGSISAVTGAFIVFFPRTVVRVFVFFFIIGVFHLPAAWFIGFQIFMNLVFQGLGANDGVARLAHIGGYAYGFVVAWALLAAGFMPREPYDLFSMGRQAKRRRAFRELTSRGHDPWSADSPKRRGPRAPAKPDPKAEELACRRAEISAMIAEKRLDDAASAYRSLRADFDKPALSRDGLLALANHSFAAGAHTDAAATYEIFLASRAKDPESPRVRLMLALLLTRYLGRPGEARPLLEGLADSLNEESQKALASALADEAGAGKAAR